MRISGMGGADSVGTTHRSGECSYYRSSTRRSSHFKVIAVKRRLLLVDTGFSVCWLLVPARDVSWQ